MFQPIYNLTRKGRQLFEEKQKQNAFEELERRLHKSPVLHLPDNKGRFNLYSDTIKCITGNALYQIQSGKLKINSIYR